MHSRKIVLFILFPILVLLTQCTVNPATGEQQFTAFMSPAQERQIGAEEHPKILSQFGGIYDENLISVYVTTVGDRLAEHAEYTGNAFTFTVLDDPLVNAFALPGGYVYVTRGLMALANSEAELAGVVAHEIGHVTGRHTAERYSQANLAGVGSTLLGVLLGSPELGQVAQQGAQLYLLSFSRNQELEADRLGVRYLARAGYDPFAEADFLDTLRRETDLQARIAGRSVSESDFFSTHPNTADRVRQAIEEAEGQGAEPNVQPRYPDRYLDAIDGMIVGDNPEKGLVRGQVFWHPALGFTFTAPRGFTIINTANAVIMQSSQNSGAIFDGDSVSPNLSTVQYLTDVWGKELRLSSPRIFTVNGRPAASASTRVSTQQGTIEAHLVAIRFADDRVYRFQLISPPPASRTLLAAFDQLVMSFRPITEAEKDTYPTRRIDIVTVAPGDTVASLARRMPYDDGYNEDRLLVLNGLRSAADLQVGQRIKLIVEE